MDKKVLVADVPEMQARVAAVLVQERLVFVHTLAAALKALAGEDFDLVLIGLHFDDSRMFDLLREVRAGSRNGAVPIVCFRTRPFTFAAIRRYRIRLNHAADRAAARMRSAAAAAAKRAVSSVSSRASANLVVRLS
jgi:CheY-like chemotaxis protein